MNCRECGRKEIADKERRTRTVVGEDVHGHTITHHECEMGHKWHYVQTTSEFLKCPGDCPFSGEC
jgi:hypothetical protein